MDHLPRPSYGRCHDPSWRCPTTKLLRNFHDGHVRTRFGEYPVQRGINTEDIISGNFSPEQQHDAAAIAQNWLFFGVLETFLDLDIEAQSFLTDGPDGEQYLCTQSLQDYCKQWLEKVQRLDNTVQQQAKEDLNQMFRVCSRFFQVFMGTSSGKYLSNFGFYLGPIAVLLETLQLWRHVAYGVYSPDEPLPVNLCSVTADELFAEGWCRYTVANIILASGSPSCFAYARQYRGKPDFIHGNHSSCTANRCSVVNIDMSSYQCEHRSAICKDPSACVAMYPDLRLLGRKLESKETPVVRVSDDGKLDVTTGSAEEYVAISHVWSDGMGSTSEQGLWACQIHFLSDAATAAYNYLNETDDDHVPFWLDAVCVPERQEWRQEAIIKMSNYYAEAAAVVVIDNMLLEISVEDPIEEQLFVLYISNWVQRMWTLPEVLLSKQLLFRLKDGLVDFRTYFSNEVLGGQFKNPVVWRLLGWFVQLMITPLERSYGHSQPFSLDNVALHLAKRTSSKPEDEVLAIAGLFDLDVRKFLPLSAGERMMTFLADYNNGKVPADILFLDGPKLKVENFSWAPQSFMNRLAHVELSGSTGDDWSIATSQGLLGSSYFCLQLQRQWNGEMPCIYRLDTPGNGVFTIVFQRRINVQEDESLPEYNTLVLSRNVEPGEELLAAGCQSLGEIEAAEQGDVLLHLSLQCYVHVFNETGNPDWNRIPIANEAHHRPGLILIA